MFGLSILIPGQGVSDAADGGVVVVAAKTVPVGKAHGRGGCEVEGIPGVRAHEETSYEEPSQEIHA